MTRTRKAVSALIASIMALVFALSTCVLSFAAETPSVGQKVYVVQIVTNTGEGKDVEGTEGVYVLIPDKEMNPMPAEGDVVKLVGNHHERLNLTFTEPGTYQYTLGKVKESSLKKDVKDITVEDFEEGERNEVGELVRPLTHVFGFVVDENMNVTPYTCDDPTNTPLNDGTGLSLWNYVSAADKKPEPSPSSSSSSSSSSSTKKVEPSTEPTSVKPATNKNNEPVTNSNGSVRTTIVYANGRTTTTTGTGSRANRVNTGDESHLVLWVAIAGIAVVGMIILLLVRRKKDNEEENS